ncbi:hypothetical protein [Sphingomonas faeni]|uniref:hypothetical protein n=1 Tax=Sphingomonas faeni TaxID=185950 RepID=UPI00335DAB8E
MIFTSIPSRLRYIDRKRGVGVIEAEDAVAECLILNIGKSQPTSILNGNPPYKGGRNFELF